MPELLLDAETRERLWARVTRAIEAYVDEVESLRVTPELDPEGLRARFHDFDFSVPRDPDEVVDFVVAGLREHAVQTAHPQYYGLFNPAVATASIAGDALVAAFNPQMASYSHHPFGQEVEGHLLDTLGSRFGLDDCDGTFCSGGAEANHTALLTALNARVPAALESGLRALDGDPVLYVSSQSHHSFIKAARCSGLGRAGVRAVGIDDDLRIDVDELARQIEDDSQSGHRPFMIVATAGSTNAGVIDPLTEIADLAARERLWFHVDAAWGGAGVFLDELRPFFTGIERADSITFDAHKWMSVPMGAGIFLTRHREILSRTFHTAADYMPHNEEGLAIVDPYHHSLQWSRRAIGMKLFTALSVAGWPGYEAAIRHQVTMGDRLRTGLAERGWRIVNDTPLPVICFTRGDASLESLRGVADSIGERAWISTTLLDGQPVLRACITNYRTQAHHVDALIELLEPAGREISD